MAAPVDSPASAEPRLLGPRITAQLLGRRGGARRPAGPQAAGPDRDARDWQDTRLRAARHINEAYAATWGSVDAPMGGWKDSGVGSRHGEPGILTYTSAQTISLQRLVPIAPPGPMPPGGYAKAMTAAMRALQRLPGRK